MNDRIESVGQLEVLLLLSRASGPLTADAVARELRIDPAGAEQQLQQLVRRGLVAGSQSGFVYAPATPELAAAMADLARLYADRRVTVISLIYSKPPDALRSFADAFRIRKDPSDG